MRKSEIDECIRAYRIGLEAYVKLEANLKAAESATAKIPLLLPNLQEAQARLAATQPFLERLGDSLAHLPEMATQLAEERRISASLRRQAMEKGIQARYDEVKKRPEIPSDEVD